MTKDSQDSDENIRFRPATDDDLEAIVMLLADDEIGQTREDASLPLNRAYRDAFAAIRDDPNQIQLVAVSDDGAIIGTLQLSFIPGLARTAAWRGQIEGVRIAKSHRSAGLGQKMFEWAIGECRARGCALVQLTTDKGRPDAHRFYDRLGFEASHEGYKLKLT
jgi:GNAT superfamily N-acetyltransferase